MNDALQRLRTNQVSLYLRIKHPTLDPVAITEAFGLTPEHAVQAGPSISARGVRTLHSESYWLAELPTKSIQELAAWTQGQSPLPPATMSAKVRSLRLSHATGLQGMQILLWLRAFETRSDFIRRINTEGGSVTLVLQRPDRDAPFNLTPALARQLAELEIALEID